MGDCLTVTSGTASTDQRSTDGMFEFAVSCAGGLPVRVIISTPPGSVPPHPETSSWMSPVLNPVPVLSLPPDPKNHGVFLSAAEQRFSTHINDELNALGEPLKSSVAADHCKRFVENSRFLLSNQAGIRWAIFGDELDGIALVAHSKVSKRQVTLEFATNGALIKIIQIDECMHRRERSCRIEHILQLENAVAWLNLP